MVIVVHLLAISDPAPLRGELESVQMVYNTVQLHAGLGYVNPDDEHSVRRKALRQAGSDGLE